MQLKSFDYLYFPPPLDYPPGNTQNGRNSAQVTRGGRECAGFATAARALPAKLAAAKLRQGGHWKHRMEGSNVDELGRNHVD